MPAAQPHWDVVIMHGGAVQTESFPMPAGGSTEN